MLGVVAILSRPARHSGSRLTHFRSDSEASVYASPDSASFLDSIKPGSVVSIVIAFDIPKGATVATLVLHESLLSGGVMVSVS